MYFGIWTPFRLGQRADSLHQLRKPPSRWSGQQSCVLISHLQRKAGMANVSGYYNSDLHVRSDGQDFLLVSDAFASSVGISTRENGSLSILYKDNRNVDGYTQRLLVDAQVEKNQTLRMVPRYDVGDDAHRSNILSLGLII